MEGLQIGRVVHYVAYGTPKGEFPQNVHRAATITEVNDAEKGTVSICVMNPTGLFFNTNIPYLADGSQPGTWHWPEKV